MFFMNENVAMDFYTLNDDAIAAADANFRAWLDAPGSFSLAEKNLPLVEWSLPAHRFWAAK